MDREDRINQIKTSIKTKRPGLKIYDGGRESAVMIPLVCEEGVWKVLFQVRSKKLSIQPGDICFPGGGIEGLETGTETAIRETCEELLIDRSQVELLGKVDGTMGPSGAPMWAYVCVLHDYRHTFSKDEVEEVFLVPLEELLQMEPILSKVETRGLVDDSTYPDEFNPGPQANWHVRTQTMPFYYWKDKVIWGATGRVLYYFLQRLKDLEI